MTDSDLARPVDGDDPSTRVEKLVPKLVVELDGERAEFLAYANPNQWALMRNAEAAGKGGSGDQMAAIYRLATTSVKPEELDRFNAFMLAHGQNDDLIDVVGDAMAELWSGATMLPLVPTSSGSSSSTGESASTSEDDSLPPVTGPDGTALAESPGYTGPAGNSSPDFR